MLLCANSQGKGSDTSSAEGVPPISRKWEFNQLQQTTQITRTHMLNTDLNVVNGFGKRSFRGQAVGNTVGGIRAIALLRMS